MRVVTPTASFIIAVLATLLLIHPLAAQQHYLLVSSRNGDVVQRFNGETGAYIDDLVTFRSGGLQAPQEIIVIDGNLLVTGRFNQQILRYDVHTGAYLGPFSSGFALNQPTRMALGPDSLLYVCQWGSASERIARFRSDTGTFVDEFTSVGLNQAMGLAWDAAGTLYAGSFASSTVTRFDTAGQFIDTFIGPNPLAGPVNLWIGDSDSSLFVLNWGTGSVLRYATGSGDLQGTFLSQGLTNGEGMTVGPDGNLYICDRTGNQVNRYAPDGRFLGVFTSGGSLQAPNSLIFVANPATSVMPPNGAATGFHLAPNYPNPFNPTTRVEFRVHEAGWVNLSIFDMLGQRVATLVDGRRAAGRHQVVWNGRNDRGVAVASGMYLYRLTAGQSVRTRRMALMR